MSPSQQRTAAKSTRSTRPALLREERTTEVRVSYPTYYAAFVIDPDGNNMEAVYRGASPT